MNIDKIPHKLLVKLYKRMLSRKHDVEERIGSLSAVEQNGIMSSCYKAESMDTDESRKRILRFLNDPSRETWEDIYKIQVTADKTFWNVWIDYDPQAPKEIPACESIVRRWSYFPCPEQIMSKAQEALIEERDLLSQEDRYIEATIGYLESVYPVLEKRCRASAIQQCEKSPC